MFLSNNLNQCISDYGRIKTNYILNNGINLGSFEDIVTRNSKEEKIEFEFDIQGELNFFSKVLLDLEFEEKFREKNTNYKNIFDAFEKNEDLMQKYSEIQKIDFSFKVYFRKGSIGFDLERVLIYDKINKIELKIDYDFNFGDIVSRGFSMMNNNDASKYFKIWLNFDYSSMEDYKPFSLRLLPSLRGICGTLLNTDGKLYEYFNYPLKERIDYYYDVLKFCYVAKRIIPQSLMDFLSFKHLPATREIIKPLYLIDATSSYVEKEYFELLDSISEPQYNTFHQANNHDNITKDLINSFRKSMIPDSESRFEDPILIESFEDKHVIEMGFKINYQDVKCDKIKFRNNTYFYILANYYLNKFEFKLIFYLYKIENGMKISLFTEKGELNASNSSSGFMQVFPILISCCNFKDEYYEIVERSRLKVEEFKVDSRIYIPDKYFTLLIEQPELHLHPKLQSQLAELFSDTIKDLNLNSLIIETHSEHLIRKIQVLIAKGELDKERVGVSYFDNSDGTTKIKVMEIESNGFLKEPWPFGFFDESYKLSKELLFPNKN